MKIAGKPSKTPSRRKSSCLEKCIVQGLQEGLTYVRGGIELRTRIVAVPEEIDVRAVREKTGFSQAKFALRFGFSRRTIQEWEQGRAKPDSAVRAYLTVIDRNPTAVEQALHGIDS